MFPLWRWKITLRAACVENISKDIKRKWYWNLGYLYLDLCEQFGKYVQDVSFCESKFCSSVDHWRMLVWSVPIAVPARRHPPPQVPITTNTSAEQFSIGHPQSPTEPSHPSTVFQGTSILCGQICWSRMFASLKSPFPWVRVCVYTFCGFLPIS